MDPAEYEISTDPNRVDVDLVHDFLSQSYWAEGRTRGLVEKSIRNSLCFGVYQSQKQVAFARVVTDRAVFAYLADVFVVPSLRSRGISKLLMRRILEHPDVKDIKMFLLGTRDAHGLYAQFGFSRYQSERLMVKYNQDGDRRAT
jgi:N-acetylglutamate synthase-like GNAT family acetyltransferase